MLKTIRKFYLSFYKFLWHEKILMNKISLPECQSIFTIYDLFPVNGVKVVKNNQEQLKSNIISKPIDKNTVHFLGAPFVERDSMKESIYIEWVREIRNEYNPDIDFTYILHPWESDEFGAKIKNDAGVNVKRFGLPYELELMQFDSSPAIICSWFCTALDNLAEAVSAEISLISYRLPSFEELHIRKRQKPIFDAGYEFYRRHSGETPVEVREIPNINKSSKLSAEATLSEISKGTWKSTLLVVTLKGGGSNKEKIINKAEAALNNLYFASKSGGVSTILQTGESISEAISRICLVIGENDSNVFLSEGISENIIETWLDVSGGKSYQLALDFAFTTEKKLKPIKKYMKEELSGGIENIKPSEQRMSELAHIKGCQKIFDKRENTSSFINQIALSTDKPKSSSNRIQGIKVSMLVMDDDKKILIAERSRFPEKGYFGLPSLRLTRSMTLDAAFEELAGSIFNFKLNRSFADEVAWLEVFSLQENDSSTEEHIIDLVYMLKVPSRHLVKLNSSTEAKRLSWWDYKAFSMNPLISKSAEKLLPKILTEL